VRRLALAGAVVAAAALAASPAAAQSRDAAQPGRFEVAFGATWSGRTPFGGSDATETAGTGGPYVLFTTSSELAAAAGAEARVGVRLTRLLQAEATGSYSTPELQTKVSADVEQAAPVTATDRLQQFTVGGALVLNLPWRLGARGVPFVTGGAAYLRQLHEGQAVIESGQAYYAGGGVKYWFLSRAGRRLKAVGLRADVRALARTKAVALDRRTHTVPSVAVSLAVAF